ncbi:MAG: HAD family hydrolase [Cyanobacteria bacterium J06621_8]
MNQAVLQTIDNYDWGHIRLIASDMDGTLTSAEKFDTELLDALARLAAHGIDVLITTGRSAGWVQAIATYLPIAGAMAENGGLLYWQQDPQPRMLSKLSREQHRQQLEQVFKLIQSKFPQVQESWDNRFRITDWTFDLANLNHQALETITLICQNSGFDFTYSTIQCHIKPLAQDKASGLNQVLPQYFPHVSSETVVTVGDSPNDESMFNLQSFPLSVGVANVLQYRDRLKYLPAYVTKASQGAGFCEFAAAVLRDQKKLADI